MMSASDCSFDDCVAVCWAWQGKDAGTPSVDANGGLECHYPSHATLNIHKPIFPEVHGAFVVVSWVHVSLPYDDSSEANIALLMASFHALCWLYPLWFRHSALPPEWWRYKVVLMFCELTSIRSAINYKKNWLIHAAVSCCTCDWSYVIKLSACHPPPPPPPPQTSVTSQANKIMQKTQGTCSVRKAIIFCN